ncbi:hypothetical protein [Mucilaginibacter sp.]|uniref:hypothetical protein n=1 Tax=Mucilaginibacter sp. TaxID=1882438 RepID=UPI0035BBE4BA
MLRSELYELEKFVDSILKIEGIATSYPDFTAKQVGLVKSLCADLKKKWTHDLLSNAKDQVIKRYVQYHQAGITGLSDKTSRYMPALDLNETIKADQRTAFQELVTELENLLDFLHRQFYTYFDIDHKTTIYHCELLNQQIKYFEAALKAYQSDQVQKSLILCILASAEEVATEGLVAGISYRQSEQCLNVVRMLHQMLIFGTNTTTEKLVLDLYRQNANSLYFFNWHQEFIADQLAKYNDKKQRNNFLNDQIKILAAIFVLPEKAIQPELPSTDAFILPWLQEQINTDGKHTSFKAPSLQLPLNLSVPQFAVFIRICYKTGCFPVENIAMIIRFFTTNFTTKKQPHISHKSFGRAFYNLDQSAAAVVRDYLQKMLNYLNKTYFP